MRSVRKKKNDYHQCHYVSLGNTRIESVEGLNTKIAIDIIMKDDIIDVSVAGRRCIINRTPDQKGNYLLLFAKHGKVLFRSIEVREFSK